MSIRFIVGRSGTGKTRQILSEIKEQCDALPQGDPIYVIVPDQMSFHTEYQLLKQSKHPSLMRVQGLSFKRFAHRILQETGGLSRDHLDEVGLALLLKKVMNDHKEQLSVFSSYVDKAGFIQKVTDIISEFKNYQVTPTQLMATVAKQQLQSNHSTHSTQKLHDLALIYHSFEQVTLNQYLMSEDYYTLLADHIATSQTVANSDFYIDGYHLFNKQEEEIIFQLMTYAKSVTLVLTHDLKAISQVFSLPMRTFSRLVDGIKERGLTYTVHSCERHAHNRFKTNNAIAHLEQNFLQYPQQKSEATGIHFFSAVNRRLEIEEVAKRIYHLVHKEGYAYSDIAIYTSDEEAYDELIAAIFPKFDIPLFLDHKESMIHHPLMTMIHHLFDVILYGWRHESLFTLLKTGLFLDVSTFKKGQSFYDLYQTYHQQLDQLENYCLARNIKKRNWLAKEDWSYERYRGLGRGYVKTSEDQVKESQLNTLRRTIANHLSKVEKNFKEATTYKEFAMATFRFLEDVAIPQKLALFEESAVELNQIQQLKQHEQVWTKLLSLFEQLVEIGENEEVTLEDFASVFKAGIEGMTYTTVPPRLDQVAVGSLRRARYQLVNDLNEAGQYGIKHGFVLGVNEGQIPKMQSESSLISEGEREQLKELGIELAPSLEQTQIDEQFILYTVFTSPKVSLTLSYASSNDEGKEFLPSYLYHHVKNLFPQAKEAHIGREIDQNLYDHLTTIRQSVAPVIQGLKASFKGNPYYEPLLTYYQTHEPLIYHMLQNMLNYENDVTPLDETMTKELYTDEIVASVSRLELFNQCAFSHYVRYGLKLQERELYRLDLPHIGELYHEALKRVADRIQEENRTFKDLTPKECETLAKDVATQLSDQLLYQILKQNKRMEKLMHRLTQVVYKTLIGLKYQGEKSDFKPIHFEMPFGKSGIKLSPRPLKNGFNLSLRGVVDRIDVAKKDDQAYLRIIDYKSSQKQLDLDSVYYGLSLQLLTYLDVVVSNALQLVDVPADVGGLLYFHVHHPFVNHDEEFIDEIETKVSQMHQEKYKMTGYLPQDYDVVKLSDQRLGKETSKSDIVPISLKKDGSFAAVGNSILAGEQLDLLREYTNKKIEEVATQITEGNLSINPVQHDKGNACTFCSYRSICQFDPDFEGNVRRMLPKMKAEIALDAMKTALEKGEE